MHVIGLTGGIATGKSTVSTYIAQKGIPVIDADLLARQMVLPKSVGLQQLVTQLGQWILNEDGTLNRSLLAQKMFADSYTKQTVEAVLHPLIFAEIERLKEAITAPWCVIDMPLLYELNYERAVDEVWLVYTTPEVQLARLMQRHHWSKEEALQRIRAQWPIEKKRALQPNIIDNTMELQNTYQQVDQLIAKLFLKEGE